MNILGISPLDKDATVSLMVDGRLEWAIAEERLSRQKMHAGFPYFALEMLLDRAGITPADVNHVMYAFYDWKRETELMRRHEREDYALNLARPQQSTSSLIRAAQEQIAARDISIPGLASADERMEKPWHKRICYRVAAGDSRLAAMLNRRQLRRWIEQASADHRKYQEELLAGLAEFGLKEKLQRVEHHQSHVANAFYFSGFERALVVTIDAYGSGLSGTVSLSDYEQGIRRLDQIETPYSLGVYYEAVTSAMGFQPDRHAGKIVGLAAYGDPELLADVLRNQFVWEDGRFRMRKSSDLYLARYLAALFPKIDVAAAYQTVLEEVVARHVAHHVAATGADTIVLSGGVAANVKLNQRIHEIEGVRNIYIHPAMGDGGCAAGAAALKAVEHGFRPGRLDSVYLGPEYSEEEIEAALRAEGLAYEQADDVEEEIARLIAEDHVVARFDGRMEYGPRALGNRSILYPARDPAVNQWLNERLGRTEFMPFAPATLAEDAPRCYRNLAGAEFAARFMTITFDCTPEMKQTCPAAVHVDGTARPQLVSEESNPSFYRILREYKALTGISSIINTSFNMHEEPIVCTPEDAIRAFRLGRLDALAIGSFLVRRPEVERKDRQAAGALTAS